MTLGVDHQRVGLFGGTFDPVHQGHLTLARHVLDRCRLDRLLFIPAAQPPHKQCPEASFVHRQAMIQAALQANLAAAGMSLSLIEQELAVPSYTIQTIETLCAQDNRLRPLLILGADSLLDLCHWHRASDLLDKTSLIVVRREGIDASAIGRAIAMLPHAYQALPQTGGWIDAAGNTIVYLADVEVPVSSSAIREELSHGLVPPMLPPTVFSYISQHHLYGWGEAA